LKKIIHFKFHFCFVKKIQPEIEANFTDHHPIHQMRERTDWGALGKGKLQQKFKKR